jgi:Ca2+-transporting ATPase
MNAKPKSPGEPIMPRSLWLITILYGLSITAGVLGISAFAHFFLQVDAAKVNNMAFYTLVLAQLLNVFNLPKPGTSFFRNEITRNAWVWGAILLCILLTGIGYIITPLRDALSLVPLTLQELLYVVVFSIISLGIAQISRLFVKYND